MRISVWLAAFAGSVLSTAAYAQTPADVPAGHWAAASVRAVVASGVMSVRNGRFRGSEPVSRIDMIHILAQYARTLERHTWPSAGAFNVENSKESPGWEKRSITRYQLAALLDRVARNVLAGLPVRGAQPYGGSIVLPRAAISGVGRTDPVYDDLRYLVDNRMLFPQSVLLKPDHAPATGKDATFAITTTIAGLNDRLTDEPQNRPEIAEPPARKR